MRVLSNLSVATKSFSIPFDFVTSNQNFNLENRFIIFSRNYPTDSYMIHSYDRKDVTLVTEISEFKWLFMNQSFSVGRNYIRSGPTMRNAGLFSSFTPSLNHASLHLELWDKVEYNYHLIRLDDRQSDEGAYKRWGYYRRLQFPVGTRLILGLKDFVLATGVQRGVDFAYLNPAAIFQLEQLHGNVEEGTPGANNDNQMMGMDIDFKLGNQKRFYFDFLLDEFQIDVADRDHAQDVFGLTLGFEQKSTENSIFIEYWLASPWLYTNGGKFTNVEVNQIPLGYIAPNAYGFSFGWKHNFEKHQTFCLINMHKQGDQTVSTPWDSVDNIISLGLPDAKWEPELDLRFQYAEHKILKEFRLTYNLLNSRGFQLIATFQGLNMEYLSND